MRNVVTKWLPVLCVVGLFSVFAAQAADRTDGEPMASEHAREDPNYRYFPETGEERYESLLAAPLIVQSVTTGVLVIQTLESRGFDRRDVELMQTCAQLLAPVVVNAQLLSMVASTPSERSRIVGQVANSITHPLRLFATFGPGMRPRFLTGNHFHQATDFFATGVLRLIKAQSAMPTIAALIVNRLVGGNRIKPRAESALRLELLAFHMDLQEGLLKHILGHGSIAEETA